ncbi:retron Ec48 family effector membrane protein [Aquabacterium sp. OR-4]|uniref:retron Ec48 family effector membrane protein n=1 Tax=Aquabacterium sp. OR-4 TaxID=2978127 RepID=UPI0021B22CE8|nr:retron Ec48 family effector membrane protein [Aquabacterium sp. OR-4]MDT7836164.1 retron Ec48 family effector membrane protein [Aquabacterium sp. OR-4]
MNKVIERINETPRGIFGLGLAISIVLISGLGGAIAVFLSTIVESDLYRLPVCLTNECAKDFLGKTDQAFIIAKATIDFAVGIATTGGIFVALLSYFNTAGNAALANHIGHLKVFSDYLDSEIKKRDRLASKHIDTLLLYASIFDQSRGGKTSISPRYHEFIRTLNNLIEESNARSVVGTPGGFSYNLHQRRMRDHMLTVGITVYLAPRVDYLEMEDQIFSLINRINQSFCAAGVLPMLAERKYR